MSSDNVPFLNSLASVYGQSILKEQTQRYKNLYDTFVELYHVPPGHIVRAPGRVNLIGEHIDYSNFSVLPMAIAPDILVAIHIDPTDNSRRITLQNTNPRFPKREIDLDITRPTEPVTIDSKTLEWSNYFKAGYLGHASYVQTPSFATMKCLFDGSVPTGSGLSSSAAMVVSSLISSLLSSNQTTLNKRKIVELAMISERNVGVNSGGMDQAASVFGEKETAVLVQFAPELRGTKVSFPSFGEDEEVTFVVANSLVNADKHDTAPENYNLRVVETTCSADILARRLGLGRLKSRDGFGGTLHEVVEKYFDEDKRLAAEDKLDKFQDVVADVFSGDGKYSQTELAEMMGLSEKELVDKYMTRFPVRTKSFKLLNRTRHVLSEARRVVLFRRLLDSPPPTSHEFYKQLGALMNASQDSCRDDFQCSCPELDELTQIARNHGAYGARLTGAGWGGAIVALTTKKKADGVIKGLVSEYYNPRFPKMTDEELGKTAFATQPGSGALVYVVGENGIQ